MTARTWRAGLVLVAGALAACGDDDGAAEPSVPEGPAATLVGAGRYGEPAESLVDACALVGDEDVAAVFAGEAPEAAPTDYGEGFAECEWATDDAVVLVSLLPIENFASDYLEQLNVTGSVEAAALGDDAVSFPGVVGIGQASGGGATVGFTSDATGVLVGVRTGDGDESANLPLATDLAVVVAENL